MNYCEVCGGYYSGKACPMTRIAHRKIEKLISLYGSVVHDAIVNDDKLKDEAYKALETAKTDEEFDKAYMSLVMAYYIRFQITRRWSSSLTFETYWGMLIHSCPAKFGSRLEYFKSKYGDIVGLKIGYTYQFCNTVDTDDKIFENSLFIVRTDIYGWVITKKGSGQSIGINYKELPKRSSEEYIMGYAKCVSVYENWL